jgi:hypothetical protein
MFIISQSVKRIEVNKKKGCRFTYPIIPFIILMLLLFKPLSIVNKYDMLIITIKRERLI